MPKQMAKFQCPTCGTPFRSKLRKGKPVRSCPECSWSPPAKAEKKVDTKPRAQA
jgi:DNA-directed RNA polymerase subunit RPC12/RpoP